MSGFPFLYFVIAIWFAYYFYQLNKGKKIKTEQEPQELIKEEKSCDYHCVYCLNDIEYDPHVFRENIVCQKCHSFHSGDVAKKYRMSCARSLLNSRGKREHFSVCDFRDWAELLHIDIPESVNSFLNNYHCTNWDMMTSDEEKTVMSYVLSYLDMFEEYNYLVEEHNKKVKERKRKT